VDANVFYVIGAALIVIGIIIIVVAMILASMRGSGKGKMKSAGVIMIGPVPIIFGTDKKSVKTILVIALALTVSFVVALIVFYLLLR
jgi:uncharacterized protein (TIGR00304 family)